MPPPEDASFKTPHSSITYYIPDGCWYIVFDKLDSIGDQESFGLTCHHFLDIQSSSRKRLEIGFSGWSMNSYTTFDNMIDKLLNRFRQLEILCLGDCFQDSSLSSLQNYPYKLHILYLAYTHMTDVGLAFVASGCQFLSVISIRYCYSISDSGLEILTKSCKLLKEVDLCWCKKITDRGILSLNQNCRQLRALNISGCDNIVGETFQGCSPTLAYLEAEYCDIHQMGVTGILCGGGIEYLNLSSSVHRLEHGLVTIGLGFAANLKSLHLSECKFLDDTAIMEISKGCPLLQEWDVSFCDEIRLSGWESIGFHCQNLERLNVSYCDNFYDEGLQALGDGCKRLTMLCMKFCRRVTQYGILNFKIQREDVQINEEKMKTMTGTLDWASTRRFRLQS